MRDGIRQHLSETVPEILNCYGLDEPTIDTPKPYGVILQRDDTDNGNVVGFKRTIEIILYENRTMSKNLDSLADKVVKALDMKIIEDTSNNETFTCIYEGAIKKDTLNESLNAIGRKLKFTVIGLHEEDEVNTDSWLDVLGNYTKGITNLEVYLNNWRKNFEIPSILWRVKSQSKVRENNFLIKESKTLICHIASNNKNEINKLLDNIENKLITDLKIPLNLEERRYLTIESIEEDREADMLSKGQLTVKLFRKKAIETSDDPTINKIYSKGTLKED